MSSNTSADYADTAIKKHRDAFLGYRCHVQTIQKPETSNTETLDVGLVGF